MKKVFLILICVLAGLLTMTSCVKATNANSLKYINKEYIESVDGPSKTKKTVHVNVIPRGEEDDLNPVGFIWLGGVTK
jgi:uncharacterized alpha/beta hydrolase family protein